MVIEIIGISTAIAGLVLLTMPQVRKSGWGVRTSAIILGAGLIMIIIGALG